MTLKEQFVLNFVTDNRWKYLVEGLGRTLTIAFFAVLIGVLIGIVVSIIRSSYDKNCESMARRKGFGYYILKTLNGIVSLLWLLLLLWYILFNAKISTKTHGNAMAKIFAKTTRISAIRPP